MLSHVQPTHLSQLPPPSPPLIFILHSLLDYPLEQIQTVHTSLTHSHRLHLRQPSNVHYHHTVIHPQLSINTQAHSTKLDWPKLCPYQTISKTITDHILTLHSSQPASVLWTDLFHYTHLAARQASKSTLAVCCNGGD